MNSEEKSPWESKVTLKMLPVGTKIYYTGDRANNAGHGVISDPGMDFPDGYFRIEMKDGRVMGAWLACFQPQPGRRFWVAKQFADMNRYIRDCYALGERPKVRQ